jgi:hypothetical protein
MDTGWWRYLITRDRQPGRSLVQHLKERYQNRERVRTMLLNQKLRCYQLSDDGKGLLKGVPQLSDAHMFYIDLDLKWINLSRSTVTIDQCWLVFQSGWHVHQFPCTNRENGGAFSIPENFPSGHGDRQTNGPGQSI